VPTALLLFLDKINNSTLFRFQAKSNTVGAVLDFLVPGLLTQTSFRYCNVYTMSLRTYKYIQIISDLGFELHVAMFSQGL